MEAILDDLGSDLGEFGDLMADGLGVVPVERVAASGAGVWLDLDGGGQMLGGDQLAGMTLVAGLATPPLLGGRPGRLPLDVERLGGWRLGGVRGVLVEPGLEGGDPLLEGLDQGEDGRLDIGGRLGPEVVRQWWLGAHAIWCNRPRPRAQAPTGRERLRPGEFPGISPGGSFNPLPALRPGERQGRRVDLHRRAGFNPLPALKPGESRVDQAAGRRDAVSIRSRR